MTATSSALRRSISLPQAIALYVGAVVGAGVLILPGVAASIAGPASLLAWGFDGLLGFPLALTFAFLATRFPDAGGVATFTRQAFGPTLGAVVGWFYFFAATAGQIIVPLTGSYYVAAALGWGREATFLVAVLILILAVASNLRGLRLSGRVQLILSGGVTLILLAASIAAFPHIQPRVLTPVFPHGALSVGRAMVFLFYAFFGWEAVAQLSSEFHNPSRDVLRSTIWSVILVTLLYLAASFAVVATGVYGTPAGDRVTIARVLALSFGSRAVDLAAGIAVLISLGTANAYIAATSRLGYALGRDGAFPAWMSKLTRQQTPHIAILVIGGVALVGLCILYFTHGEAEQLLFIPNSLGLATYLIGTLAGIRLLSGWKRVLAIIAFLLCLLIFPFAGASIVLPLVVGVGAVVYQQRHRLRRSGRRNELTLLE